MSGDRRDDRIRPQRFSLEHAIFVLIGVVGTLLILYHLYTLVTV